MSRTTKACILLCAFLSATPAPAAPVMGVHGRAARISSAGVRGSLVAGNPRPFASTRAPMPSAAPPASRPATSSLPHTVVTRPTPPLQRTFGGFHRHHHHGPAFVFIEPPFFVRSPFLYSYPYSAGFYSFEGPLDAYAGTPSAITAPFYCWIDGIAFTDQARFAHHLHEVHGVPLEEALSSCEPVGGRCVFFGF